MVEEEIFKEIPNYEGLYSISNFGNIKSFKWGKEKILKKVINKNGYVCATLRDSNNNQKNLKVHVLVAVVFHGFNPNGKQDFIVDHKDNDKSNCNADNLQIITQRENVIKHHERNKDCVGVNFHEQAKKWRARIYISGKNIHLGLFNKKENAGNVYKKAFDNIHLFNGDVKDFKNKIFNLL